MTLPPMARFVIALVEDTGIKSHESQGHFHAPLNILLAHL